MKKNIIFLTVGALLIITAVGMYVLQGRSVPLPQQSANSFQSQINSEGEVEITVVPLNVLENSPTWDFSISTSTHSVDIQEDFTLVMELTTEDADTIYRPIQWQGDTEGHHRTGVLSFSVIKPKPQYIELRIKNIGGIPVRTFRWQMSS